jgi:hypothetical protein
MGLISMLALGREMDAVNMYRSRRTTQRTEGQDIEINGRYSMKNTKDLAANASLSCRLLSRYAGQSRWPFHVSLADSGFE